MTPSQRLAAGILVALSSARLAAAQEPQPAAMPAPDVEIRKPLYLPPVPERPRRRIGGSAGTDPERWPRLYALVPRHTALTGSAAPSLLWWISAGVPPDTRLTLYLVDDSNDQTLLRVSLPRPRTRGIQRVRAADHGVELRPGVEYEWSVALERGPDHEQLVVASGWIERTPLTQEVAAPGGLEAVGFWARRGLWYDALTAAADLIEAHPGDPDPREARDALLEQVGLAGLILR